MKILAIMGGCLLLPAVLSPDLAPAPALAAPAELNAGGTCSGCSGSRSTVSSIPSDAVGTPPDRNYVDQRRINCDDGTRGAVLVVQNINGPTSGTCAKRDADQPVDDASNDCVASGSCTIEDKVTIQIPSGSCFSSLWVTGGDVVPDPNNYGGRAEISSTTVVNMDASAGCGTNGDNYGWNQLFVYTGVQDQAPSGYYTLVVKCSECKKKLVDAGGDQTGDR